MGRKGKKGIKGYVKRGNSRREKKRREEKKDYVRKRRSKRM